MKLQFSIIYDNTVGAGDGGPGGGPDLAGDGISSLGHNLIGDTGPFSIRNLDLDDLPDTDPMLGPLADNGGPTLSRIPLIGSPVRGLAERTGWPWSDQRGFLRPTLSAIGSVDPDALIPSRSDLLWEISLRNRRGGDRNAVRLRADNTDPDREYQVLAGDDLAQLKMPAGLPGGRVPLTSRTPGTGAER